jgi:hypothetical protein
MVFFLCLFSAIDLEPRSADGLSAVLRIDLAPEPEGIGLAGVWLRLTVNGSSTVEIDGPRLEDPLAAWRERVRLSTWTAEGTVVRSVYLVQRKQGPAPLPDVIVRVRAGPGSNWHEWAWYEPLGASKPVAPIEITPSPPAPPGPLWPWASTALAALVGIGIVLWRRFRRRLQRPRPSPEQWALQRLEQTPDSEIEPLLRQYLQDAFALRCGSLTRTELGELLRDWPKSLREELESLLKEAEAVRYGPLGGALDRNRVTAWIAASGGFREFGKNKDSE